MGLTSSATSRRSFETRLPPRPASVARARARVRGLLRDAGREDLLETALLLTSEVVTNALLHAGTEIDVVASLDDGGLRVEVRDGSPHLPSRLRYAATAGTGRGLLMVEELGDDWGVTRHRDGKTVWFRLSTAGGSLPDPVESTGDRTNRARRHRDSVAVELRNMPLLLHAAWQEHAEATDAIAVLEEHVPRTSVKMTPDRLMPDAIEPRVSARLVEVPVPVDSVAHFETLDKAIEAALDLSAGGLVLTPPTQPEVQAFRRWLCRQVLVQAAGGRPEPWRTPEDASTDVPAVEDWDPRLVTGAAEGVLAADASSRILAVSAEAARILGYDDPAELVGRRIVTIVPERYRQAHVAGFTMYLLVGRRPLLDRTVTLPALRRDGSEVAVRLTVRSPSAANDRSVLLADIALTDPE